MTTSEHEDLVALAEAAVKAWNTHRFDDAFDALASWLSRPASIPCARCAGTGWVCDQHYVGACAECHHNAASLSGCPVCTPLGGCGGTGDVQPASHPRLVLREDLIRFAGQVDAVQGTELDRLRNENARLAEALRTLDDDLYDLRDKCERLREPS